MKFNDKVALVTGAYQGLGKGISRKLGEQGCKLILVDIDKRVKDTEKEFSNLGMDFYFNNRRCIQRINC